MNLSENSNTVIIHYGCSDFEKSDHIIFWIGAIFFVKDQKVYFFEDGNELEILEKFKTFLDNHKSSTYIHWSMNTPKFGFTPMEKRYQELSGSAIKIEPVNQIDLSEYFKNKYGINYVERDGGRLNNLAKLNGFTGFKDSIEVKNNAEASDRLELLFSIHQAETQGRLKISRTAILDLNMWNEPCFELFKYFTDTYYTGKSIQLTSIWFFLNDLDSDKYRISCTKEVYKDYINTHYNLEIKHFDKSSKWDDVKRTLNDYCINFENM